MRLSSLLGITTRPCLGQIHSIWLCLWVSMLAMPALADKTAADYYVHSLPGQPDGPLLKMHAGHIEVNHEHNGNLFFWHFANRHIANRARTVIWLNGGPGCSSEDGALMELGPYRVREGGKLEYNEGSWDEFANVLFVDNPVGTGFSYVDTDSFLHELDEMADNFITFLEKFFDIFPEFANDDLYLAGESYAGQHIPYIAQHILDRNAAESSASKKWNLKGLLIGNGWIAPIEQYQAYVSFAYKEGLITHGTDVGNKIDHSLNNCLAELGKPESADKINVAICEQILNDILYNTRESDQCINMYDIRLRDSWPSCGMSWPPDLDTVTPYLRRSDVTQALHVNPDKRTGWTECSGSVSANFRVLHSKPSVQLLPGILEAGVPVTLFSGAKDMICNHVGTEDFIANMKWNGGTGFELSPGVWAPKRDWTFEGEAAGLYQEARNLTYVLFYNSSHMVPFDYPRRTRDMLDRFMGVDIASIGGKPVDSQIDGEKAGTETSVGGHTNSTAAVEENEEKIHQATLKAYYRSGEVVLLVVVIAAALFGWWVWSSRRKARLLGEDSSRLGNYMPVSLRGSGRHDIEAQDFNEAELERLGNGGKRSKYDEVDEEDDPYDIGSNSEEDAEDLKGRPAEKQQG